jgi:hypothetical protein
MTLKKIVMAISLIPCHSCSDGAATVHFDIAAKTPEGLQISGASVTLDDVVVGQTNAFGTFALDTRLSANKRHKIAVTKDDSQYYYAPHFESFKFASNESKSIAIAPKMYLVPKPKTNKIAKQMGKSSSPSPRDFVAPSEESQCNDLPLLELIGTPFPPRQTVDSDLEKSRSMFTVHVYSGRSVLGGARVTWIDSQNLEAHCTTNDRGRCIIDATDGANRAGSLLVQHEGLKSSLTTLRPTQNSNTRITLEPGRSFDIRTVAVSPWSKKPIASVIIRSHGVILGTSNDQGIAVVNFVGTLPAQLDLEAPQHSSTIQASISAENSNQILVRFPDQSQRFWPTSLVYRLHLDSSFTGSSGDFADLPISETALAEASHAQASTLLPGNWHDLPSDAVAFLPVLRHAATKFEIQLVAFTNQGAVAMSDLIGLDNRSSKASWQKAAVSAVKSLRQNLPWSGIVTGGKGRAIEVAISTEYLKVGDRLTVEAGRGPLGATVTAVQKDKVLAEIADDSVAEGGNTLGAIAFKTNTQSDAVAKFTTQLDSLVVPSKGDSALRLAHKYFAENNPREALTELAKITSKMGLEPEDPQITQLRATLFHATGQLTDSLHNLQKILELAANLGQKTAVLTTEANIVRTQIEALLVVPGDHSVAARFEELAKDSENIASELLRLGKLTGKTSVMLEYTKLLALRKKAECDEDLVALATQSGVWTGFQTLIDEQKWTGKEANLWKRIANGELAKIAIIKAVPSSDDVKQEL